LRRGRARVVIDLFFHNSSVDVVSAEAQVICAIFGVTICQ
jgi:hypothetical protein